MHENSIDQSAIATATSLLYVDKSKTMLSSTKKLSRFWAMVKSKIVIGWYEKMNLKELNLGSWLELDS